MVTSANDILGPVLSPERRETRAAMVMTLFGAFGRDGASGDLGNELDSEFLQELRAWADVVLVSSGTVAAERYGPSDTPIAVLSRSLDIDPSLGVFSGRDPIIVCPERSLNDDTLAPQRTALAEAGARFLSAGDGSPSEVIDALHRDGFNRIACEGGPSVYADMIGSGLLDVVHVTLDPSVSAADGPWGLQRISKQRPFERRYALEAAHTSVDAGDSMLFLRYRCVCEG
ncbi:dihydrofolate reductase family protein [Corynebacterium sp. HMSC034A01]|uniref:dihydrofolate reductase family protein n=1 Tax=Corynebacterium sp. HMSC034A01 TaxID=1739295 RepID=UPI0008A92081|nr:dihydrofolate reductase family protein [Corynebacterium sp. HMSC034A01]